MIKFKLLCSSILMLLFNITVTHAKELTGQEQELLTFLQQMKNISIFLAILCFIMLAVMLFMKRKNYIEWLIAKILQYVGIIFLILAIIFYIIQYYKFS